MAPGLTLPDGTEKSGCCSATGTPSTPRQTRCRALSYDSAYLADFLKTIPGPIVLVGHSFGGMVITNGATGNPNVKALVYIDAFIPDQGDTAFGLTAAQPGSCLSGNPTTTFNFAPYPDSPSGDLDAYLKVAADGTYPGFAACFANGIPQHEAATGRDPAADHAQRRVSPVWSSRLEDHPIMGPDRYRRPRHPASGASVHGEAPPRPHQRGPRGASLPDLPPLSSDPGHHPGRAGHELTTDHPACRVQPQQLHCRRNERN